MYNIIATDICEVPVTKYVKNQNTVKAHQSIMLFKLNKRYDGILPYSSE